MNKELTSTEKTIVTAVLMIMFMALMSSMTSCSGTRNGYGCHGKESWNHMVRRINSGN